MSRKHTVTAASAIGAVAIAATAFAMAPSHFGVAAQNVDSRMASGPIPPLPEYGSGFVQIASAGLTSPSTTQHVAAVVNQNVNVAAAPDTADGSSADWLAPVLENEMLSARARVTPRMEAVLSSDMDGRLISMSVEPGEKFKKGQVLAKLDCTEHQARLRGAEAVSSGASQVADVRKKLVDLGSVSELEVALAVSEAARAKADLELIRAQLKKCSVRAPFNGRVVDKFAHTSENVSAGAKLLSVINDSQLQVELLVPSAWLQWLTEGATFAVKVDETERSYTAVVRRLGAQVDAVSQSLTITADLTDPSADLLAGMSGVAVFDVGN